MYIADLHIHSHYSYATSKDCCLEAFDYYARRKGIQLIGTGDFTHPAWRKELEEKLEESGNGLYHRKKNKLESNGESQFVITGEISSIYKQDGKTRRVHSVLILPGLKEAEVLAKKLGKIGNISSDGRPILSLSCKNLLEMALDVSEDIIYIPAHIWTPHFSMFGAFTGFSSVEECFGELTPYIHALETGLSSDPAMNYRISALDKYQLVSSSDAHSPSKLGREATIINGDMSYESLWKAIQTREELKGTIEFFSEEGKYYKDGHRKCNISMSPTEAEKLNGVCPVCGKKLTFGVCHRIEQLADREKEYSLENAMEFKKIIPLQEIIADSFGFSSCTGKKVMQVYESLLLKLGCELDILCNVPIEDIKRVSNTRLSEGIDRMRKEEVLCEAGYDGKYGKVYLWRNRTCY